MFERASRDKAIARDNDDDQAPTNERVGQYEQREEQGRTEFEHQSIALS